MKAERITTSIVPRTVFIRGFHYRYTDGTLQGRQEGRLEWVYNHPLQSWLGLETLTTTEFHALQDLIRTPKTTEEQITVTMTRDEAEALVKFPIGCRAAQVYQWTKMCHEITEAVK